MTSIQNGTLKPAAAHQLKAPASALTAGAAAAAKNLAPVPHLKNVAPAAQASTENTGRWTAEEHRLFLQGLEQHGKGWKKIASLIRSRTVVQIRTHAQKYFQKLAKARQNGEGLEDVHHHMGGAGGAGSGGGAGFSASSKKRKAAMINGNKRKGIKSVVASVANEHSTVDSWQPMIAPSFMPYMQQVQAQKTTNQTIVSSLEDAMYRYLTPAPEGNVELTVAALANQNGVVNSTHSSVPGTVAPTSSRQTAAGLGQSIILPQEFGSAVIDKDAEGSPTGVADLSAFTFPFNSKDPPTWFAKGDDVEDLLKEAGNLDWLSDPGVSLDNSINEIGSMCSTSESEATIEPQQQPIISKVSLAALANLSSAELSAALPSMPNFSEADLASSKRIKSEANLLGTSASNADFGFDPSISGFDDQAFVAALLENE